MKAGFRLISLIGDRSAHTGAHDTAKAGGYDGFILTVLFITPKYTATAKLYVLSSKDSVINLSDLQLGNYLASDYQEVFKNRVVYEEVMKKLGLSYTRTQMSKMLRVTNPADTRIL